MLNIAREVSLRECVHSVSWLIHDVTSSQYRCVSLKREIKYTDNSTSQRLCSGKKQVYVNVGYNSYPPLINRIIQLNKLKFAAVLDFTWIGN